MMDTPSPAGLRAARAVNLANSLSRLYLGRSLNLTETAALIDAATIAATVDPVTVYPETVDQCRAASVTETAQ